MPSSPSETSDALADRFGDVGLQHLVYVSKAAPESPPEMLSNILQVSRRKNHAAGITGLLVYFDGRFLQYLEGPGLAVGGTLSLIKSDTRHYDLEVLLDERTDRRPFRRWDMGCLDVGSEGWRQLVEADWPTIRSLARNSTPGLQVLQNLAQDPADTVDRIRVLGSSNGQQNFLAVPDIAPELRRVRLQFAAMVIVAVILAGLLLYKWLE